MRKSLTCFVAIVLLAACSAATAPSIPSAPVAASALSYTWSKQGTAAQTGPIDFDPWSGIWPNVVLQQAQVTVSGAVAPLTVSLAEKCATIGSVSGSSFTLTQGNNGSCVALVQDAAAHLLPVLVNDGLPGRPQLELSGFTPQRDGSFTLALSAQTTITAFELLAGQMTGGPFTGVVYGGCASITPSQVSSSPGTFTLVPLQAGTCFAVIGNSQTQSLLIWINAV